MLIYLTISLCQQAYHPVKHDNIAACYDLSLLKLVQAWHMPWSADSHHSFQRPYRAAVKVILLCINRAGLPNEIAHNVVSFMPRSCWPDERARCWCNDCLLDNSVSLMTWKLGGRQLEQTPKLMATKRCPTCSFVTYKKGEHRKQDAGNHGKYCNKPPYRTPGAQEAKFCRAVSAMIAGDGGSVDMAEVDDCDAADGDDGSWDDEGSWESIDSNENQSTGSTHQLVSTFIFDWFNQKTYKTFKNQESGFLAMYNRDD